MTTHSIQFERHLVSAELVSPRPAGGDPRESETVDSSIESAAIKMDAYGEEIKELLTQISASVTQLQSRHVSNLQQLKTTSVQLALMVVGKIVGGSQAIQTERLAQLLEEALNRTEPAVGIHLHPQDLSKLDKLATESSLDLELVSIIADESVLAGECRVDYATYELTSSLTQQIEEIEHRLLEVVNDQST